MVLLKKNLLERKSAQWTLAFLIKKVIIKGCAGVPVPTWAYLIIVANLAQVADKIYFGEPRHAVKIFNRDK